MSILASFSRILSLFLSKTNLVHAFKTFFRNNEIKSEFSDSNCKIHLFCSTNAVKSSKGTEPSMFSCTYHSGANNMLFHPIKLYLRSDDH